MLWNEALDALQTLFSPGTFVYLMLGVFMGLLVGLIPGLGGVAGMSLLLPFIFGMEPSSAMAMMVGIMAANHTSDTFAAVLVGVPGSAGAGATVMDGYPLAKMGQAGRALGASFTASMIGGLFGAVALFAVLPFFRQLILAFGTPDLFMLAILGITMVAVLSHGAVAKSMLAAVFGMLLSTIGAAPASAEYRFTFGSLFLSDGFALVTVAMAIFAIPEFIDMLRSGEAVSDADRSLGAGRFDGVKDTISRPGLTLGSSGIGALLGAMPGIGGSAISWIVYGLAAKLSRNNKNFGKGDIRGVIAPEAANNAMEAGQMVPTLMFGLPSSGTSALLLGGLILLGIQPGPNLMSDANISIVLVIAWSLAVGNVLSTIVCFALRNSVARLCFIPGRKLVPFLAIAVLLAVYQAARANSDMLLLLFLGTFAWFALQSGWSRAALLVGFILGDPAERYLWISMSRFGWSWLTEPGVLVIAALLVFVLVVGFLPREAIGNLFRRWTRPSTVVAGVPEQDHPGSTDEAADQSLSVNTTTDTPQRTDTTDDSGRRP